MKQSFAPFLLNGVKIHVEILFNVIDIYNWMFTFLLFVVDNAVQWIPGH